MFSVSLYCFALTFFGDQKRLYLVEWSGLHCLLGLHYYSKQKLTLLYGVISRILIVTGGESVKTFFTNISNSYRFCDSKEPKTSQITTSCEKRIANDENMRRRARIGQIWMTHGQHQKATVFVSGFQNTLPLTARSPINFLSYYHSHVSVSLSTHYLKNLSRNQKNFKKCPRKSQLFVIMMCVRSCCNYCLFVDPTSATHPPSCIALIVIPVTSTFKR